MENTINCNELFNFFIEQNKYRNLVCSNNKICYFEGLSCKLNEKIDKPFLNDLIKFNKIKIIYNNYGIIYYENNIKK